MKKDKLKFGMLKEQSGEITLEATFIVTMTIFLLLWLLGVGFLYYQRYLTRIAVDDAAVKIASTYNNIQSDMIMGYVETENLTNRDLYRNFNIPGNSYLRDINEERANSYIQYTLDRSTGYNTVKSVDTKLDFVMDSVVRKHIKLTVTCTYNTPFGEVLEFMGMDRNATYEVQAMADCTDYLDYASSIAYFDAFATNKFSLGKMSDSIITMINSLVKLFNHITN